MSQKVLMFGWEFPPYNSGGLGVACLGLTKSLVGQGVDIQFVLPQRMDFSYDHMEFLFADPKVVINEFNYKRYQKYLNAYSTLTRVNTIEDKLIQETASDLHIKKLGQNIKSQVMRYTIHTEENPLRTK